MTGTGEGLRARAIDWLADHPMSLPGRLATLRFGIPSRSAQVNVLEPPAGYSRRVLIAPANYAGQARAWSAAIESDDRSIAARNYALESGGFAFDADMTVPAAVYHNSKRWQVMQRAAALGFTHFIVESFLPPFGRLYGRDLERQIASLGPDISVALMCHGSDVRRPSLNRARTELSPFHADDPATARLERLAVRHLELITRLDLPTFVSTPDLLDDVPTAQWCPVVVDVDRWALAREGHEGPLRVVHAPSKASMKGSAHIEPVLERLAEDGVIAYAPLRGIPHERVPEAFAAADVVVDQLSVGSYGVAACEAMAAGCAVVSHVTDRVREIVAATTGLDLPIIEAGADTLEAVIRDLADGEEPSLLAAAGRGFVRDVHDGRRSAEALHEWITQTTA